MLITWALLCASYHALEKPHLASCAQLSAQLAALQFPQRNSAALPASQGSSRQEHPCRILARAVRALPCLCCTCAPELSASVHPPGCARLSGFHPQQLPSNIYLHCFVCSCALWGGSVFALRRRFLAVARAEAWQMGGDGRSRSMMNLFFLPCLKLPVKIQQPHLRSA